MTIDIARDFSLEPIGRYVSDSPVSGEVFREHLLWPALCESQEVQVVLDGTEGYGSSFLEESFGGLIRHHDITEQGFADRVRVVSIEDPSLIIEIQGYVADAQRLKQRR